MARVRDLPLPLLLALAAPATPAAFGAAATTWHHAVDASLAYADGVGRPAAIGPALDGAASVKEPTRALGLKRFRLELGLSGVSGARLFAVLRPDAMNRQRDAGAVGDVTEYDARACSPRDPDKDRLGGCYRPQPTVRLLDAYHLAASPAESLEGAIGVFEGLEARRSSYEPPLAFGLAVRLPDKFSALRLTWRNRRPTMPTERAAGDAGFSAEVYALQGDEERVEALAAPEGAYDTAPAAKDPYYGGAGRVGFKTGGLQLSVLAGQQQSSALPHGRRNEVYGQLFTGWSATVGERLLRLNLDVRLARETWRVSAAEIDDRTQQSAELSASFGVASRQRVLAGFGYGQSDRPAALSRQDELMKMTGYQLELGAGSEVAPGLEAVLMLSHERRRATLDGTESGGFFDEDGARSTVRRVGLELAYRLDGNT